MMKKNHLFIIILFPLQISSAVVGCSEQLVQSAEEALGWLGIGNAARVTGVTQMNQRSSRSHAVFTVHISEGQKRLCGGGGVQSACVCVCVCACVCI